MHSPDAGAKDALGDEDGAEISCTACTEFALGRAFDAAGNADSALAHFTAYLAIPVARRIQIDYLARAAVEKHLGELYDARKNNPEALAHYGAFVALWKGADPELQPAVAAVKRRMAELVARYHDLPLGTVDASVIAAAERLGTNDIATLDRRHFAVVRSNIGALNLLP